MMPLGGGAIWVPEAITGLGCLGPSAAAGVPLDEAEGGDAAFKDLGAEAEVHVSLFVKDMQKRLFSCSFSTNSDPRI